MRASDLGKDLADTIAAIEGIKVTSDTDKLLQMILLLQSTEVAAILAILEHLEGRR